VRPSAPSGASVAGAPRPRRYVATTSRQAGFTPAETTTRGRRVIAPAISAASASAEAPS
jgi:hypothetical protein